VNVGVKVNVGVRVGVKVAVGEGVTVEVGVIVGVNVGVGKIFGKLLHPSIPTRKNASITKGATRYSLSIGYLLIPILSRKAVYNITETATG
jgi:hypothetical protein